MKIHSRKESLPDVLRSETCTSRGLGKYFRHLLLHLKKAVEPGGGAHAFNPSTREAEAGGSLWVRGQSGLQELVPGQEPKRYGETLSQKIKKTKNKTKSPFS